MFSHCGGWGGRWVGCTGARRSWCSGCVAMLSHGQAVGESEGTGQMSIVLAVAHCCPSAHPTWVPVVFLIIPMPCSCIYQFGDGEVGGAKGNRWRGPCSVEQEHWTSVCTPECTLIAPTLFPVFCNLCVCVYIFCLQCYDVIWKNMYLVVLLSWHHIPFAPQRDAMHFHFIE